MIYDMKPVDGLHAVFTISFHGHKFAEAYGGNAIDVYEVFCNLKRFDERRADDFMHGAQLGLFHVAYGCNIRVVDMAHVPPRATPWPPIAPRPDPTPTQNAVQVDTKPQSTAQYQPHKKR